jgi:hypothetical protein
MLIYVDQISERLVYVMHFIFDQHGMSIQLTNDKVLFQSTEEQKLSYSSWSIENCLQIEPATLVFEEQIDMNLLVEKSNWNNQECLSFNGITDPIAAIFYTLTRYEEYTSTRRDKHGRFEAKNSILLKFGWLQQQIVEHWVESFISWAFPNQMEELIKARNVQFVPTFDIDNTYAFLWKEGWRKWLSSAKDLLQRNKSRRILRNNVLAGNANDPYDCFDYLQSIAVTFPQTRFFWLLGDFAEFDKNISWLDKRHQQLIRAIRNVAHVGLHPSYASNTNEMKLQTESERLASILAEKPIESRQHFLKLYLPHTYQKLIQCGFERDFSMGFADEIGFRAGTAHPYLFFDLSKNEATPFEIWPFAYMDGTLHSYKKWSIEESEIHIRQLVNEVKKMGGIFSCIWHNETIAEAGDWKDWKQVFEFTMNQFKQ